MGEKPPRHRLSTPASSIWLEVDTGKMSRPPLSHVGPVRAIAWHPEGEPPRLRWGRWQRTHLQCQPGRADMVHRHECCPSDVVAASWSADGSRLIVWSGLHHHACRTLMPHSRCSRQRKQACLVIKAAEEPSPACAAQCWQPARRSRPLSWREAGDALAETARHADESSEVELLAAAIMHWGSRGSPHPA
jgi:hypothetical protein